MAKLRNYREADLEQLKEILVRSGFPYSFPELCEWQFNPKLIVEDDAGRIAMGAGLRLTSEAYLWVDSKVGTPAERWQWLKELHEGIRVEAKRIGYSDVHAFLPPGLPEAFRRRLRSLGWVPEEFEAWWRSTS